MRLPQFRQGFRLFSQDPAFAIAAVLTIALGIGANTAVYAVVHAVLLEPLPFRDPDRLVQIWETHPELHNLQVSVPDYDDWKRSFQDLEIAAYTFEAMDKGTLTGEGEPLAVQATNATSDLFPLFGIEPLLGRTYTAGDEKRKQPVAMISEQLWRSKFSGNRHIIGREVRIDATSFTIVGVLPQRSAFPVWADVWLPFSLIDKDLTSARRYHPLEVIGRLKRSVSLQQAELETAQIAGHLSAAYPDTNGKIGAVAVSLMEMVTGEVRPALLAVWVAVGLVLLIACANLAHLMMSRALSRKREVAVRLALGATTWTVFEEFLFETCLLAFTGGLVGVLAAYAALPIMQRLAHGQLPRLDTVEMSFSVLLFGLAASFATALIFALPSYVQVLGSNLNETLASGSTRTSTVRSRLSAVLMSLEVAFSVAVLVAAIMLVRSFALTLQTDSGFKSAGVFAVHLPLVNTDWKNSYRLFHDRVAPELERVSGVQEVGAVNAIPMSLGATEHSRYATRFGLVGRQFEPGRFPTAQIRWCTANYFSVLGIPLRRGRWLTEADHNQPLYLVNEAFARQFFPHSDPVGQKILLNVMTPHPETDEIAGVVGDIREFGLTAAPVPTLYTIDVSVEMQALIKTADSGPALQRRMMAVLRGIDPRQAVGRIRPLDSYIAQSLARQRFILTLITTFAALAIFLCGAGIYGVFSYSVTRRMREFGIRSAIGARGSQLLGQVIHECLVVIVPGIVAGLAISAGCSQFVRSLLYRVSPTDVLSTVLAAMSIAVLCLMSVLLPAVRAARIDPVVVLREE